MKTPEIKINPIQFRIPPRFLTYFFPFQFCMQCRQLAPTCSECGGRGRADASLRCQSCASLRASTAATTTASTVVNIAASAEPTAINQGSPSGFSTLTAPTGETASDRELPTAPFGGSPTHGAADTRDLGVGMVLVPLAVSGKWRTGATLSK